LGAVVLCIFSTSSIIIRQSCNKITTLELFFYPILSFTVAILTISIGLCIIFTNPAGYAFIAGHNVIGLGLICSCLAVETTICTKFSIIRKNLKLPVGTPSNEGFSTLITNFIFLIIISFIIIAWGLVIYLLINSNNTNYFIAGHILAGMAMICTSVFGMVASGLRQINNTYNEIDKKIWPSLAFIMGFMALSWGIILIMINKDPSSYLLPGFILIGISCICFSIFSKLLFNTKVWRANYAYSNLIPFIPLFLYFFCIFLSSFLFQASMTNINLYIPARVLIGIGAVCISLFAIINVLRIINTKKPPR
jgi:hypothetical protein